MLHYKLVSLLETIVTFANFVSQIQNESKLFGNKKFPFVFHCNKLCQCTVECIVKTRLQTCCIFFIHI